MAITEEHKERVVSGLAEELEKEAKKGKFPIDVDSLVKNLVDVMGIEKFNRMLSMCTVGLYLATSSGKYVLMKHH